MCKVSLPKTDNTDKSTEETLGKLDNFKISDGIKAKLEARGITSLLPIQYKTYKLIHKGKDVICEGKTDKGKTFAYGLPVLTKLEKKCTKLMKGRKPRVIIMAPTFELVDEITTEFNSVANENLSILNISSGKSFKKQEPKLEAGLDVVVGTPDRIEDLLNGGTLDLSCLKYVILDDVDKMLDKGFQVNVEKILENVYNDNKPQNLLFTSTMSQWVNDIIKKYLSENIEHICLDDNIDTQTVNPINHLALQPSLKNSQALDDESTKENLGKLDNFKISKGIKAKLEARGINSLFPIQYKTYSFIYEGSDVIGQAKTGTGKTFAFGLPILTKLEEKCEKLIRGRKPRVVVMAPTRELVNQIATEFSSVAHEKLSILSVYGGISYEKQESKLRAGLDIVVGAPGRIQDLINRGTLDLSGIKYVILDEVDKMLDMGFQVNVEKILENVYNDIKPQTLLFSATMPQWIQNIVKKYLSVDAEHVCLVNDNDAQTVKSVQHLALQCPWQERSSAIADVLRVYGGNSEVSRTIIFCERKRDADELAAHSSMPSDCSVLHGDIPQEKREMVLKKYREGKYTTLITTNVTARGIDIPDVDLVIQCHPPMDVDDYIHRSGRTGRAGKSGVCICFYEPKERDLLAQVERKAKFQFKRISPPSTSDIVTASLNETIANFERIPDSVIEAFKDSVSKLFDKFGAEKAMALALVQMSGKMEIMKPRSVLSSRGGFVAFQLKTSAEVRAKSLLYNILRKYVDDNIVEKISSVQFLKDKTGFVFDISEEFASELENSWKDNNWSKLCKITELPEVEEVTSGFRNGNGNLRGGRSFYNNNRNGFKRKFDGNNNKFNSKIQKF